MDIKKLISIMTEMDDPILAIDQADSIQDLKTLCEVTEDGGTNGVFADLHIQALRRFVEVSKPSDLDVNSIAWMAGMYGVNVEQQKMQVFREACDKGSLFREIELIEFEILDRFDGCLTLSMHGEPVIICRDTDWEVSLENILGDLTGVKSILFSDWDVDDSRLSAFLQKLSNNYFSNLEDITIVLKENVEQFPKWIDAFRNAHLLRGAIAWRRLFVESDGEFIPPSGALKVEGKEAYWIDDALFVYEDDALKGILGNDL